MQPETKAQMAELVDASDSKSGVRKDVQVRFLFWAQFLKTTFSRVVFFYVISSLKTYKMASFTELSHSKKINLFYYR